MKRPRCPECGVLIDAPRVDGRPSTRRFVYHETIAVERQARGVVMFRIEKCPGAYAVVRMAQDQQT